MTSGQQQNYNLKIKYRFYVHLFLIGVGDVIRVIGADYGCRD